jgi:1-acyl-sn-glycerol-3-phosphate acyltransferase
MINCKSLLFNIIFYFTTIIIIIVGLPMLIGGRRGVLFIARLWASTSMWLLEKICNLRIEYRGLVNIPERGGYIIAAKHQSFLETFALIRNSPDFAIILKRELTFIPLFGLYLIVSKQIAIDRARGRSAFSQIARRAGEVLRAGRQVYIYPEGTRRPPGARPDYKRGVAFLYASAGAPCIPVALNTGLYWGRRGLIRRPGTAIIEYLPQIPAGMDRSSFAGKLQAAIEAACSRLNKEATAADPSLVPVLLSGNRSTSPPTLGTAEKRPDDQSRLF